MWTLLLALSFVANPTWSVNGPPKMEVQVLEIGTKRFACISRGQSKCINRTATGVQLNSGCSCCMAIDLETGKGLWPISKLGKHS